MTVCQKKENKLEEELRHWEATTQRITVIAFSFDAYKQQKAIVEASRSTLLRTIDALKQTANDTKQWDDLYTKAIDSLEVYRRNVQILCK